MYSLKVSSDSWMSKGSSIYASYYSKECTFRLYVVLSNGISLWLVNPSACKRYVKFLYLWTAAGSLLYMYNMQLTVVVINFQRKTAVFLFSCSRPRLDPIPERVGCQSPTVGAWHKAS